MGIWIADHTVDEIEHEIEDHFAGPPRQKRTDRARIYDPVRRINEHQRKAPTNEAHDLRDTLLKHPMDRQDRYIGSRCNSGLKLAKRFLVLFDEHAPHADISAMAEPCNTHLPQFIESYSK